MGTECLICQRLATGCKPSIIIPAVVVRAQHGNIVQKGKCAPLRITRIDFFKEPYKIMPQQKLTETDIELTGFLQILLILIKQLYS
jgi:hypothetical protein